MNTELNQVKVQNEVFVVRKRPRVTPFFIGRDEELGKMKEILDEYGSVALMNYGGVGKTQLATAFAERAEKNGWVPGGTFWLPTNGDIHQVESSLASFVESLIGRRFQIEERNDRNFVMSVLIHELRTVENRWILCIDNADNPDVNSAVGELCRIVNDESMNGWIVVTSRQGGEVMWDEMVPEQKLKLEPLSVEHAMIVLYQWKKGGMKVRWPKKKIVSGLSELKEKDPNEYNALTELVSDTKPYGLGGLLLALDQAGSYIYRNKVSFVNYVALYKLARKTFVMSEMFLKIKTSESIDEKQRAIWTAWKINVSDLDDVARWVLCAIALLDSIPVPEYIVKELDPEFRSNPLRYRNIVQEELVTNRSLLEIDTDESGMVFRMHRLIREFIIMDSKLESDPYDRALNCSVHAIYASAKSALEEQGRRIINPPSEYFGRCHVIASHGSTLLDHVWSYYSTDCKMCCESKIESVFRFCIRALKFVNRLTDASKLCERLQVIERKLYTLNFSLVGTIFTLFDYGGVKFLQEYFSEAEKKYLECLSLQYRVVGEDVDHPLIAATLHELGRVAMSKDELDEAREYLKQALSMYKRMHREGVDEVLSIVAPPHELGSIVTRKYQLDFLQEYFSEADEKYLECLSWQYRELGERISHLSIAAVLYQLGRIAMSKDELDAGEEYFKEALCMYERVYGEGVDHLSIAATMYQLGRVAMSKDELDDAEKYFKQALSLYESVNEEDIDYSSIAFTLHALGLVAVSKDQHDEAEEYYDKALSMYEFEYREGADQLPIAFTLHELGFVARRRNQLDEAEEYFTQALSMYECVYGEGVDHSSIAAMLHELGVVAISKDQLDAAEEYLEQALSIKKRVHGQGVDHPSIAATMEELGCIAKSKDPVEIFLKMLYEIVSHILEFFQSRPR